MAFSMFSAMRASIPRSPLWRTLQRSARRPNSTTSAPPPPHRHSFPLRPVTPTNQHWAWRTVKTSSPGTVILERTVFARPPDFKPPLVSLAAGVWGLSVLSWMLLGLVVPEKPKKELEAEELEKIKAEREELNFLSQVSNGAAIWVWANSQPVLYGVATVIIAGLLTASTRIVTRMTLRQIKDSSGQSKTVLRLRTAGHEMLFNKIKPRELKVEDCRVYIPSSERATTLRLKVPTGSSFMDRYPYSLDFRQPKEDSNPANNEKELVLSMARIQEVFGRVPRAQPVAK